MWPNTSYHLDAYAHTHTHYPLIALQSNALALIYTHTHTPTCALVHSDSPWSESATLLPPPSANTHMHIQGQRLAGLSVSHLAHSFF